MSLLQEYLADTPNANSDILSLLEIFPAASLDLEGECFDLGNGVYLSPFRYTRTRTIARNNQGTPAIGWEAVTAVKSPAHGFLEPPEWNDVVLIRHEGNLSYAAIEVALELQRRDMFDQLLGAHHASSCRTCRGTGAIFRAGHRDPDLCPDCNGTSFNAESWTKITRFRKSFDQG